MKAPSDIATTARLPPHGPLCHGLLMAFSSMLRTSMSTTLGLRPQEPLSCLNRRMGRQRDDIELRIWKDIAGCSWHETSPNAIHNRNGSGTRCRLTNRWNSGGCALNSLKLKLVVFPLIMICFSIGVCAQQKQIKVVSRGGMCPYGGCQTTVIIDSNGSYTWTEGSGGPGYESVRGTGKLQRSEIDKLLNE